MIESLYIRHFQNVIQDRITFAPGLNVIVGDSAVGKSARIRALKWVLLNYPEGDEFIGDWRNAPYAFVKLFIDGRTVSRKRGEGVNEYTIDGKLLKAFGRGVPQSISDLVNVGPLNFQGQQDPVLWFTLPPPEVSRRLNEVVRLDVIDKVLQDVASRVRKSEAKVDVATERLQEAKADAEQWQWADEFTDDVERLSYLNTQIETLGNRCARIDSAAHAISRATDTAQNAAELIVDANRVLERARQRRKCDARLARVQELGEQLTRCEQLIRTPLPDLSRLRKLRAERQKADEGLRRIESLAHGLEMVSMQVESYDEELERCRREIKKRIGTVCPTCGQTIRGRSESSSVMSTPGTIHHSHEENRVVTGMRPKKVTGGR